MKPLGQLSDDFRKAASDIDVSAILRMIGTEVVNDSMRNFRRQGFDGSPWQGRHGGSPRDQGRAILTDSGTLRDSIRFWVIGTMVQIGVDLGAVPYAKIHNEGGKIPVTPQMKKFFWAMFYKTQDSFWRGMAMTKKKEIEIPKRQFLGMTPALEQRLKSLLGTYVKSVLNAH